MISKSRPSFVIPKPPSKAGALAIYRRPGQTQAVAVYVTALHDATYGGVKLADTDPVLDDDHGVWEYELAGLESEEPLVLAARFVEELTTDPVLANHTERLIDQPPQLDGPVDVAVRCIEQVGWDSTWGVLVDGKLIACATAMCHVTAFRKLVSILRSRADA